MLGSKVTCTLLSGYERMGSSICGGAHCNEILQAFELQQQCTSANFVVGIGRKGGRNGPSDDLNIFKLTFNVCVDKKTQL